MLDSVLPVLDGAWWCRQRARGGASVHAAKLGNFIILSVRARVCVRACSMTNA